MQEIKTTQLVKQYKNLTAVDKLGLEIRQGELFSLLGVNGAGKTTVKDLLLVVKDDELGRKLQDLGLPTRCRAPRKRD